MAPDTGSIQTACANDDLNIFESQDEISGEKCEKEVQKSNGHTSEESVEYDLSNSIHRLLDSNSSAKNNSIEQKNEKSLNEDSSNKNTESNSKTYNPKIRWPDLAAQTFLHAGFLYGLFLVITSARIYTTIFAFFLIYTSAFGITAGVHRLWSHRSYKAKWPLKVILMLLFTVTGQRDLYTWALDHRVHHKYTETDSDPHDSRRGFFFSHVGWLFLTPHPDVVEKRKTIDVRDLEADPVVMWQKRWFIPLFAIFSIFIPVIIPVWLWNETIWNSFWINFNMRFTFTLNMAFAVNSVAHMFGDKPYDKNISPTDNKLVAIGTFGEGWHNYHHVFPWDYKTGELGLFNPSTAFINFFAKIGWAQDRKSASSKIIAYRAVRTGDGSYVIDHHNMNGPNLWGYGDKDMPEVEVEELKKMIDKDN